MNEHDLRNMNTPSGSGCASLFSVGNGTNDVTITRAWASSDVIAQVFKQRVSKLHP